MLSTLLVSLTLATAPTLAVHVDGDGYMRFVKDGRIVYATSATLTTDAGLLGTKGLALTPAVRIPADTVQINVNLSGEVVAFNASGKKPCGQIVLARFNSKPVEEQGFFISATRATLGNPGEGLFGVIRSANSGSTLKSKLATITIPLLTEIESDSVTLGDICSIEADAQTKEALQAVPLGSAPVIGIDMPITVGRILSLIKRAGLDPHVDLQIAPGAVIRRKAQVIKEEDFVAFATQAAQTELGSEVAFTCADQFKDFLAPIGKLELRSEGISPSGPALVVTVGVYVDGTLVNSRIVNLKADMSAQIRAGAAVKIVMISSGLTVEVPGQARTAGMVGQTITVVVSDTGSVLTGKVLSANKVEVKF